MNIEYDVWRRWMIFTFVYLLLLLPWLPLFRDDNMYNVYVGIVHTSIWISILTERK